MLGYTALPVVHSHKCVMQRDCVIIDYLRANKEQIRSTRYNSVRWAYETLMSYSWPLDSYARTIYDPERRFQDPLLARNSPLEPPSRGMVSHSARLAFRRASHAPSSRVTAQIDRVARGAESSGLASNSLSR